MTARATVSPPNPLSNIPIGRSIGSRLATAHWVAMLLATVLALGAAVLHAGWNLVAKRADGRSVHGAVGAVLRRRADRPAVHDRQPTALRHGLGRVCARARSAGWSTCRTCGCWRGRTRTATSPSAIPSRVAAGPHWRPSAGCCSSATTSTAGRWSASAIVVLGLMLLAYGATGPNLAMALAVAATIGMYTMHRRQGRSRRPAASPTSSPRSSGRDLQHDVRTRHRASRADGDDAARQLATCARHRRRRRS